MVAGGSVASSWFVLVAADGDAGNAHSPDASCPSCPRSPSQRACSVEPGFGRAAVALTPIRCCRSADRPRARPASGQPVASQWPVARIFRGARGFVQSTVASVGLRPLRSFCFTLISDTPTLSLPARPLPSHFNPPRFTFHLFRTSQHSRNFLQNTETCTASRAGPRYRYLFYSQASALLDVSNRDRRLLLRLLLQKSLPFSPLPAAFQRRRTVKTPAAPL